MSTINFDSLSPEQFKALYCEMQRRKVDFEQREREAKRAKVLAAVEQLKEARSESERWSAILKTIVKDLLTLGAHEHLTADELSLGGCSVQGGRSVRSGDRRCRPVLCIETGEVFPSAKAASEALNLHPSYVSSYLWSAQGKPAVVKGRTYQYVTDPAWTAQNDTGSTDESEEAPSEAQVEAPATEVAAVFEPVTPDPEAKPLPLPPELQQVGGQGKEVGGVHVHHGMQLRDAIKAAYALGLQVHHRMGTGEVTVRERSGRFLQINSRRKDAPRELTQLLITVSSEKAVAAA